MHDLTLSATFSLPTVLQRVPNCITSLGASIAVYGGVLQLCITSKLCDMTQPLPLYRPFPPPAYPQLQRVQDAVPV